MKKGALTWVGMIGIFLMMAGCGSSATGNSGETITISAAASLSEAMEEVGTLYEEAHPDVGLSFNFGGSGSLQQQVSQGAPVDLFVSASDEKFEMLVDEGTIDPSSNTVLLGNSLVLIVPEGGKVSSPADLKEAGKVAIGTPSAVPAGMYAKEALGALDIFTEIEEDIVYAKDVRQVLSYVETGNVEAGIVYRTDALLSDKVEIVHEFPQSLHTPVRYPAGVIADSPNHETAVEFQEFLHSETAQKVFEEYGFIIQ